MHEVVHLLGNTTVYICTLFDTVLCIYLSKKEQIDLLHAFDQLLYQTHLASIPMVGHINGGYVIDVDFREGNEAPAKENLEFIKQCQQQLPLGVKFNRVRIDSAGYQASIFNHCDRENILLTVTAKKNANVFESIKDIKDDEWTYFSKREQVAEFTHTM